MFDLSLAETTLTLIVALLLIGPEELPGILNSMRRLRYKSMQMYKEFSALMDIEEVHSLKGDVTKLNDDIRKIVDLNGDLQESYDIADIMPEIEKAKNKNQMSSPLSPGEGEDGQSRV